MTTVHNASTRLLSSYRDMCNDSGKIGRNENIFYDGSDNAIFLVSFSSRFSLKLCAIELAFYGVYRFIQPTVDSTHRDI